MGTPIRKRALVAVAVLTMVMAAAAPLGAQVDGPDAESALEGLTPAPDPGFATSAAFPDWQRIVTESVVDSGRGIAIDPATGNRLHSSVGDSTIALIDAGGTVVASIPGGSQPEGMEVHNGELFVAERAGNQISVRNPATGAVLRSWGTTGSGDGQFSNPCDMAISPINEVYVMDANNNRVQVFDINGTFKREFGSAGSGPGQFSSGCSHSGIEFFNDEVFVIDLNNHRVQVFFPDGTYKRQWGAFGTANGLFRNPTGIDIVKGKVYVADFANDRVQVFSLGGVFQGSVPVASPIGVKVDPSGNTLWVSSELTTTKLVTFTTVKCDGAVPTHVGSSYGDTFNTTGAADIIHGGAGGDTINSSGGADIICGGGGNDEINAGGGNDTVWGNGGNDSVQGKSGRDTIQGNGGADSLFGGDGLDTVNGGGGGDTIFGGDKSDQLGGGPGNDTLNGGTGNDTLNGHKGADTLKGGAGSDTLRGGEGADICDGQAGVDSGVGCETSSNIP